MRNFTRAKKPKGIFYEQDDTTGWLRRFTDSTEFPQLAYQRSSTNAFICITPRPMVPRIRFLFFLVGWQGLANSTRAPWNSSQLERNYGAFKREAIGKFQQQTAFLFLELAMFEAKAARRHAIFCFEEFVEVGN